MNFSFMSSWASANLNMSNEALAHFTTAFGVVFGFMAMVWSLIWVCIIVLMIVSRWRIFQKAGLPGWGIFVPFYNIYLMFQLAGLSGRWVLSCLFPPLLAIMMIICCFKWAKKFGKHRAFWLGILLVKFVFIPILAFDKSKYLGKKAKVAVKKIVKKMPVKKASKKSKKK